MKVLDPQDPFLQQWNRIFVLCCVIALSLDPLFFYIPVIDGHEKCLNFDKRLGIVFCVLRSFTDIFYILHIIFQFHTGFPDPSSSVFEHSTFIADRSAIAKRYFLSSHFIMDVSAALPLPQVVVLLIITSENSSVSLYLLKYVIFCQYVPRLVRTSMLYNEVTKYFGIFTEAAWAGAAFNLFLYMLASHVVGAFWYVFTIEREVRCWLAASAGYYHSYDHLYCGPHRTGDFAILFYSCPRPHETKDFDFGIFLDALTSHVVETTQFSKKFFFCSWWGLRNLSSLGQDLKTSTYVWEIIFAYFISILGLVLFSLLIGNMQKYLQSYSPFTLRVEEMKEKRRDAEQLMSDSRLPDHMRRRIRRHEQYKWQKTRGIELESFIRKLPRDLRRDMKRHLFLPSLERVPFLQSMDEQLLDAICDRLKRVLYTENSYIIREGDPIDEMLFVMRGKIVSSTTNGRRTGFFNSVTLKAGDFCGEELLTWFLYPDPSHGRPTSTRTTHALTDVEGFAITADDLKFVFIRFEGRLRSRQLQHTFRFYSQQWRTWGACFIQSAWRRHCKKKLVKSVLEEEHNTAGC